MKIKTNREVRKIESEIFEEDFKIMEKVIPHLRKNISSQHLDWCDLCLRKINQEGEKEITLATQDVMIVLNFHESCFEKAKIAS